MNGPKVYVGEAVDYQGTSPGPAPTYIVRWKEGIDPKQTNGVRPNNWSWDSLGVDEDAAKTVAESVAGRLIVFVVHEGNTYSFHFIPAPLVGTCTGGTESLVPVLLAKIADLEARMSKMENA